MEEFLLYPTVSYLNNENFLESFQDKYQTFVQKNSQPKREDNNSEVKYFAKVEEIIEKPGNRIGGLNQYHIWTNEHVKSYLNSNNAYIWLLRVYELKEPVMAKRTRGMVYANVDPEVSLDGIKPVLTDNVFENMKNNLL